MKLKDYQSQALERLIEYLKTLKIEQEKAEKVAALGVKHKWDEVAWESLNPRQAYQSRKSAIGQPVPNICFKIPTGGGKTLMAVKAIDLINIYYRGGRTGLILWIVPTTQIYNQTLAALKDRAHPYREHLNMASGDRTLILDKQAVFRPDDLQNNLVVLLLMLPSANRQVKETLRIFKDRGGFEAFFPAEEDYADHRQLLQRIPNLDVFEEDSSIAKQTVKSSLGNTLRLLHPTIILDEGHKAYGELAQSTLLGFNPSFILELSATPGEQSNKLVKIGGQELLREGMIKLDINVYNQASLDWRDTMLSAHFHRKSLEDFAYAYERDEKGPYIRPICLIQVERTGEKQREANFIHAEEVRNFLIANHVPQDQIAIKSSEKDEIENIDLLSQDCQIRYIITKQALQEGWDCPFAYILTILTNPKQATSSIIQLVGRILRQPYARKTGKVELDESYVYCYRDRAGELIRAVRAGLESEGLGDLTGRVVPVSPTGERLDLVIRPAYADYAGKVYLPCFVIRDLATGQWREIGYEMDIVSRIDWSAINLNLFDTLPLNPLPNENLSVAVGLEGIADAISPKSTPTLAVEMPLDPVFITRQIADYVPSPWRAFDYTNDALQRLLRRGYSETQIRRNLAFIIEQLKLQIGTQRVKLAKQIFDQLIQRNELRFLLLSGVVHTSISQQIQTTISPPLLNERGQMPQLSLFDFKAEDFNQVEREVALFLDQQKWVAGWVRNFVRSGYRIQGWHPNKVFPDFMLFASNDSTAASEFSMVYVLETKGLHLKGNDDTNYKQELFSLCNQLSQPHPWDEIKQTFANQQVHFQVVFEDEWKQVVNQLAQ